MRRLAALLILLLALAGPARAQGWRATAHFEGEAHTCTIGQAGSSRGAIDVRVVSGAGAEVSVLFGTLAAERPGRWDGRLTIDGRSWRLRGQADLFGIRLSLPLEIAPQVLDALRSGRTVRVFADRFGLAAEASLRGIAEHFPAFQRCLQQLHAGPARPT